MLRKIGKSDEQDNTSEAAEDNLFLCERGIGRVTGSIDKRSHDTEKIKPLQSQKRARGENGEHVQKMVIELEQGDGDQGWDEPFQGFPERLNEPRRQ
ncbi:MAG: hypothetical protein EZS28_047025 [Streblomastix strix]|uniref:Uncharacterized protein n=1 Tax=Streblomastix strix TaxID=222440 RepID=A0A5J4TH25_9EUKA|nr:MAG: hypothetical protein EZS28_047025 [Streblomastix strix]